jgi:hypothetical protein
MSRLRTITHGFVASLAVLLLLLGESTAPAGEPETPGIASERSDSEPRISSLPYAEQARRDPNICPVCGRSWNKDVHEACFERFEAKRLPVTCPSCDLQFFVEEKLTRIRAEEIDSDLCTHPGHGLRITDELTICPRCGFATVRAAFTQTEHRLSTQQQEWVDIHLTTRTQKALLQLLGNIKPEARPEPETAYQIFDITASADREDNLPDGSERDESVIIETLVPDTLRCENALIFARAHLSKRLTARMAWLTAWAYRREVAAPIPETLLIGSVQRVNQHLEDSLPLMAPPKERVNRLVELYGERSKHPLEDRQVMLLMMAGDYQRLGQSAWARSCLEAVRDAARSDALWSEAGKAQEEPSRTWDPAKLASLRQSLEAQALIRMEAARREKRYLLEAAKYLRQALRRESFAPRRLPNHVYLVGEFERRAEHLERAFYWLAAAEAMPKHPEATGLAEVFAGDQLNLVRQSLGLSAEAPPPPNPHDAEDRALLKELGDRVKRAMTENDAIQDKQPERILPDAGGTR